MKNIAFILSLLGILLLLIMVTFSEPKTIEISQINDNHLNENVKLSGNVISVKTFENNFTIFTIINNTNKIQVVCNCPNIIKSQNLEIIGKITKYQNSLQIQADKLRLLDNYIN